MVPSDGGPRPSRLALRGQSVIWTDPINSQVLQTDKKTLQTTVLYSGGFDVDSLALDDAGVYFTDVSGVYRCDLGGCAGNAQALVADAGSLDPPFFVTVGDNGVYWDDDTQAVHAVPKTGGTPTTLYVSPTDAGNAGILAAGTYVYLASSDGTIVRIPDDGGAALQLNAGLQPPSAWEMAVDSQNLYWTQDNPNLGPGTLGVVSLNGSNPHTLVLNQPFPLGLTVDSQSLYWTNEGTNVNSLEGSICMCPLSSCTAPITLASGQHIPREVAVDDEAVYWTNFGNGDFDGTLMRVAKP
jgi:hypothetical protein